MGWASGVDGNGREIGYAIEATCDKPDCDAKIDRGLAYRCGSLGAEIDDVPGCGGYFCGSHLVPDIKAAPGGGFCEPCFDALDDGTD